MTLYEIDAALLAAYENAVDPETGEISEDWSAAIEQLEMNRERKLEGVACWIKNLKSDAEALRAEEKKLAERRRAAENQAERLKGYLASALKGEKFKTSKASVTYTHSKSVVVDDIGLIPIDYLRMNEPEADKTAIKEAIKTGEIIKGVHIEENESLVIK